MISDKSYWENRYRNRQTGWDTGAVSTPLKTYIDQLTNRDLKILIPGCGNGYEAVYLHSKGFKNTHLLDISGVPLENIRQRAPFIPEECFIEMNFFDLKDSYDLVLEQTFFCALPPELRNQYAYKMSEILREGGKLSGLLFDFPLTEEGPPFGGSIAEYEERFTTDFRIKTLERCYNSIKPRQGKELFFIFEKNKDESNG